MASMDAGKDAGDDEETQVGSIKRGELIMFGVMMVLGALFAAVWYFGGMGTPAIASEAKPSSSMEGVPEEAREALTFLKGMSRIKRDPHHNATVHSHMGAHGNHTKEHHKQHHTKEHLTGDDGKGDGKPTTKVATKDAAKAGSKDAAGGVKAKAAPAAAAKKPAASAKQAGAGGAGKPAAGDSGAAAKPASKAAPKASITGGSS